MDVLRYIQLWQDNATHLNFAGEQAMLRLLARDTGGVAVVPEVVVQDEIRSGILKKYCTLDTIIENFYAITIKRHFEFPALNILLREHAHLNPV